MSEYRVDLANSGDYLFNVKSKDHSFAIDVKGRGMTPPDVLLASIGSCLGVYVRKYADSAKLPIKDFGISVQAEFSKEAPICFRRISASIDLKGAELDDRRKKAMLEFIKNCPVHNTLKSNPEMIISML